MPTIMQPTSHDATPIRRRRPTGLLARVAGATTVLVVAGSVAIATGAIPDAGDKEVHLCYAQGAAGLTPLTIYDAEQNPSACPASKTQLVINQQGPKGDTGPAGPKGATGPAGSPTLPNARTMNSENFLVSMAPFATRPPQCMTTPYTAASGQSAIVTVSADVLPKTTTNGILYVKAAQSANGQTATGYGLWGREGLSDGVAAAKTSVRIPLMPGVSYRFGALLMTNSTFEVHGSSCSVSALIVQI